MSRYSFALYALILLVSTDFSARGTSIDSLLLAQQNAPNDSIRMEILEQIAIAYIDSDYLKSIEFWNRALMIAKRGRDRGKMAHIYHQIGYMMYQRGEFPQGLESYQNALALYRYQKDTCGEAKLHNDIGLVFRTWGRYQQAIEHYEESILLFESIGDTEGLSMAANNIGQIYFYIDDYSKAIENFYKYLTINQNLNQPRAVAGASNNIASAYVELKEYDLALDYYLKALRIYDSLGVRVGVAVINDNIGSLYAKTHEYSDALLYHYHALGIFRQLQSVQRVGNTLKNIGYAYLMLKDYSNSLEYYAQSLEIAQGHNLKEMLQDIYLQISEVHLMLNDPMQSLHFYKLHIHERDSLQKADMTERLSSLEARYETEQKVRELNLVKDQVKKQRNFFYSAVGVVAALLILVFAFVRINSRNRTVIKEIKQQQWLLVNAIDSMGLWSSNQKYIISSFGFDFFAFHNAAQKENSSRIWVVAVQDTIIILTLSFSSEANLTSMERSLCINSINDFMQFSSQKDPMKIIGSLYARLTSLHIHSSNSNPSIRLCAISVNSKDRQISHFGLSPAWVTTKGRVIPFAVKSLDEIDTVKPESYSLSTNDCIYLLTSGESNFSLTLGNENLGFHIQRTLNALDNIPFSSQAEVLQSSVEFWKSTFSPNEELFILAINS